VRIRVLAYVVREREGQRQLLVFRQSGYEHFLQVPAGRGDPGESPEECLRRELLEEAGIENYRVLRELEIGEPGFTPRYHHHAFLVEAEGLPEEWDHVVSGDGDDAGFVFAYSWAPLDRRLQLWPRGNDPVLPGLVGLS
jgi:8-oxo-dGTP pyrophosphatase MutT (NUDIX family)